MSAAVDAIIVIDQHGRIEIFNNAAEEIFGYVASEILGENLANRQVHREFCAVFV